MTRLSQVETNTLDRLAAAVKAQVQGSPYLEDAAQALSSAVWDEFHDSLALVRAYATIPYVVLPASNKRFVDDLARAKGVAAELRDSTPVLSLLGSRGVEKGWNDRRTSQGHVGIPLVSTSFVDAIPMVARLLIELGVDLSWVDRQEAGISAQAAATGVSGVFFVDDAATSLDKAGRHIIPAQDFVSSHGVRTVFGVGVTYVDGTLVSLVLFTTEKLARETAERFLPLLKSFKLATTVSTVSKGRIMK